MIPYDSKRIAKNIDLRLAELGISKKQFYKESGISSANLSQWNTGANTPTSKKLKQAADYLGVSVYELTGEKEKPIENDGLSDTKKKLLKETADLSPAEMALLLEKLQQIKDMRMK